MLRLSFFSYPFGREESLEGDWLIASYLVSDTSYESVLSRSGNFAVGQTVGTWVKVPGVTKEMVEFRQGRVVSLQAVPSLAEENPRFILRIAFPTVNFGDSFAMLLTSLVGNDVSTALSVRLMDIAFANGAQERYEGPRQGMKELRALAKVSEERPLVLNMIKPCAGFSPEEGAKLFYEVAKGGVDMVKDDELLGSPSYNLVAKRTEAYLKAGKAAHEATGSNTLYVPNVSGAPGQMHDNVKAVIDAGGKACLVNYVFSGLDALRELTQAYGNDIFIFAHYAGVAVLDHPYSGISDSVFIGLLPRLAGAHGVVSMVPNRKNAAAMYNYYQTVQAQRLPWGNVKPVVTAVGGGLTPVNQAGLQRDLGMDCVLAIGGSIQGHPMGACMGAQAAMEAVKATAKNIPLEETAQSCPPLAQAMALWLEV